MLAEVRVVRCRAGLLPVGLPGQGYYPWGCVWCGAGQGCYPWGCRGRVTTRGGAWGCEPSSGKIPYEYRATKWHIGS